MVHYRELLATGACICSLSLPLKHNGALAASKKRIASNEMPEDNTRNKLLYRRL